MLSVRTPVAIRIVLLFLFAFSVVSTSFFFSSFHIVEVSKLTLIVYDDLFRLLHIIFFRLHTSNYHKALTAYSRLTTHECVYILQSQT